MVELPLEVEFVPVVPKVEFVPVVPNVEFVPVVELPVDVAVLVDIGAEPVFEAAAATTPPP